MTSAHAYDLPELGCRAGCVAEVKFLTWTEDNLLRQVVYEGLREDKLAADVPPSDTARSAGTMNPRASSRRGAVPRSHPRRASGIAARPKSGRLRRVGRIALYSGKSLIRDPSQSFRDLP